MAMWGKFSGPVSRDRRRILAGIGVAFLVGSACEEGSSSDSPERVVAMLLDRLQRVHGDPTRSREVLELLASSTRENLDERAKRASAAAGRLVGPEEMLAPSRFFVDFPAARYTTRQGLDWAIVTVEGRTPELRREIRCTLEGAEWRVVIDLPALPPIEKAPR